MVTTLLSKFETGMNFASTNAAPSASVVVQSPMRKGKLAATRVPNAISKIMSVKGNALFSARSPPEALRAFTSKSAAGPPVTAAPGAATARDTRRARPGPGG